MIFKTFSLFKRVDLEDPLYANNVVSMLEVLLPKFLRVVKWKLKSLFKGTGSSSSAWLIDYVAPMHRYTIKNFRLWDHSLRLFHVISEIRYGSPMSMVSWTMKSSMRIKGQRIRYILELRPKVIIIIDLMFGYLHNISFNHHNAINKKMLVK